MICIADIRIHKDHSKRYQGFKGDSWCTRGNAGWRSKRCVESAQPRLGGVDPRLQGLRNQPVPKRDQEVDVWSRHTWRQTTTTLKETKSFWTRKNWTQFYRLTIHSEEVWIPINLLLRKVLLLKVCELKEKHLPNLEEGDKIVRC